MLVYVWIVAIMAVQLVILSLEKCVMLQITLIYM